MRRSWASCARHSRYRHDTSRSRVGVVAPPDAAPRPGCELAAAVARGRAPGRLVPPSSLMLSLLLALVVTRPGQVLAAGSDFLTLSEVNRVGRNASLARSPAE